MTEKRKKAIFLFVLKCVYLSPRPRLHNVLQKKRKNENIKEKTFYFSYISLYFVYFFSSLILFSFHNFIYFIFQTQSAIMDR